MEFYVVYDKNDNIVSICIDLEELSHFVNRRERDLKYKFKSKDVVYIKVPTLLKVYKLLNL